MSDPVPQQSIDQAIEAGHVDLKAKHKAFRQATGARADAASEVESQRRNLATAEGAEAGAVQSADDAKAQLVTSLREQRDRLDRAVNMLEPPQAE